MNEFNKAMIMYGIVLFGIFLVLVAITRLIFAIPRFLRYQRAQLKLLEQIAKSQGVEEKKVNDIMSKSRSQWEVVD
ncbi:hypothetical protein [Mucilaginibacter sp. AK015]|uniref:hypothetical protein n=1 Tax=Mucilaginibacter sp. AK015 TaxID=2723072 RepID=UPI00161BFD1A|nr:hypothetical protein [Mucilaginibacter sp. AK015]MBB5397180.1 hypothetical protein [Mucilaginibacter sp. AK015]